MRRWPRSRRVDSLNHKPGGGEKSFSERQQVSKRQVSPWGGGGSWPFPVFPPTPPSGAAGSFLQVPLTAEQVLPALLDSSQRLSTWAAAYRYYEQIPHDMVLVSAALRLDCRPTRGRQARFRRREAQVCLLSACSSFPTCPTQTKTVPLRRPSQSISSCSSTARWSRPTRDAPPSPPISSTCLCFLSGHPRC